MSEERVTYMESTTTQWADIRFENGKHTGVRVLRGTTVIEVQREGRKTIIDIATCLPIDLCKQTVYNR